MSRQEAAGRGGPGWVLAAAAVIPALLIGAGVLTDLIAWSTALLGGYLAYLAVMGAAVCAATFRRPPRQEPNEALPLLAAAARKAAAGDYTVRLEPLNPGDAEDETDELLENFNRMTEELGSLEALKNEFASTVSRELKEPLASIQRYAAELRDEALLPETRREYADAIEKSAWRLVGMVGSMLELGRLQSKVIQPRPLRYNLCRQLGDCVRDFEKEREARRVEFATELEERVVIRADAELMKLVWTNLLSNAFKFTERGGMVALQESSDDRSVTVTVSDTGCGMDEQTVRRIFDPFYQGDSARAAGGNGLGLTVVRQVLELCGGTVSVESEPGVGTAVSVTLACEE